MSYLISNKDEDTTVKPFGQLRFILSDTLTTITCVDTNGTTLKCNWVSVQILSSNEASEDLWWVELDEIAGQSGYAPSAVASDNSLSAIVGVAMVNRPLSCKPVEIYVGDAHLFTRIKIHNRGSNNHWYAINYGYRKPYNAIRASTRPDGD